MPIRAQAADGSIHEFPDGTDPTIVDKAMKTYADENKPLSWNERQQGHALNVLSFGGMIPAGDEIVGGLSAAGEFISSGGDTARAGKAYDDEVKHARQIQQRYQGEIDRGEQPFFDENGVPTGRTVSNTLGFVAGIPAFEGAYAGGRALWGMGRGMLGMAPQATGFAGRVAQTGAALAGTGVAAHEAHEAASAEGGIGERLQAMQDGGIVMPLVAGGLAMATGPAGAALGGTARAIGRELLPLERRAARYIAEKLGRKTPDEWAAEQQAAVAEGKPAVLADVGPPDIKAAAGVAAREPGPGRQQAQEVLGGRQEGQVERVSGDVGEAVGNKPGTFIKTTDDIQAQRAAEAKPLYEEAMRAPPLQSPKLTEIVNRPSAKSAMQRGLKIAQDEGIPMDELIIQTPNGPAYSTKALHYMKLGLDDMISAAQRTGDNSAARAFVTLKSQLLGEMDRLNPAYAKARASFAGHSANNSALEAGRAAHNAHPDQITKELAGLSAGEQEFYRRGFAQRLIEEVERSPDRGNAVQRIFGNTAKRKRIKAVLGEEKFNELAKKLGIEQGMYDTYAVANVGSNTAERQAEALAMDEAGMATAGRIATGIAQFQLTGYAANLIRQIGMGAVMNTIRTMRSGMREHIAKLLFSGEKAKVDQAVKLIAREHQILLRQQKQKALEASLAAQQGNEQGRTAAMGAGGIVGQTASDAAEYVNPF
jgi:hypothetical protein